MTEAQLQHAWRYACDTFACGEHSIHGPTHWRRVEENGLLIAELTMADPVVVRLFATFHDSCRRDDGSDPEHGPRAAEMLVRIRQDMLSIDDAQFEMIVFAVRHHTDGELSEDPTIGTCWDADRLDLGRVGMVPSADFMSTRPGREMADAGGSDYPG